MPVRCCVLQPRAFSLPPVPMPAEKATAIVLRLVDFSETSLVVTLFTREFGKVRALAKGGRRPKGPFESALDLLSLCRIVFLRKSSDALDLLTEAKLERRFRPPRGDLLCLYAGYYVAELLDALTHDDDPHPELFDAADAALAGLGRPEATTGWVLRIELAALRLAGHLPTWRQCAACGRELPHQGRAAFSAHAGGALCAGCRPGQRHVISVSRAVIDALEHTAQTNVASEPQPVDPHIHGELRAVMQHYLTHVVGRPLRMHEYLR